jgi:hypothetical protein
MKRSIILSMLVASVIFANDLNKTNYLDKIINLSCTNINNCRFTNGSCVSWAYNPIITKRELNNGKLILYFHDIIYATYPLQKGQERKLTEWEEIYCVSNGIIVLEKTTQYRFK